MHNIEYAVNVLVPYIPKRCPPTSGNTGTIPATGNNPHAPVLADHVRRHNSGQSALPKRYYRATSTAVLLMLSTMGERGGVSSCRLCELGMNTTEGDRVAVASAIMDTVAVFC